MKIKSLSVADAPACAEIWQASKRESTFPIGGEWSEWQLKGEIEMHQGLGAFDENFSTLTAFVLYRVNDWTLEVTCLATSITMRRQGLMSALLLQILRGLNRTQAFWLEVHEGNFIARKLYENLNLQPVGERRGYYKDGCNALLFEYKPLQ